MLKSFTIKTKWEGLYNITSFVRQVVIESGVQEGIAVITCPHTTAAIAVTDNSDIDDGLKDDIMLALQKAFPDRPQFRNDEGNSNSYAKAMCIGNSKTVIIDDNRLVLGSYQGIFLAEFDEPTERTICVKILKG